MYLFKRVSDLQRYISSQRDQQKNIGFVPTMGALHEGHLTLIERSKSENDITVCSIFVNPTQFNDKKDLDKYPRTTANDISLLTQKGTEVLFLPPALEVYPKGLDTKLDLKMGQLDRVMEGEFRPGHFEGMAQVVKRLLDIVNPHHLYMGQKDYQQLTIVRSMIRQLNLPVKLVMCPIKREEDGLAMSSRNVRLKPDIRKRATILSETLKKAKEKIGKISPVEIQKEAMAALAITDFKPEYFRIVDGITLLPVEDANKSDEIVACTAVWAGEVRLIDNMILKS